MPYCKVGLDEKQRKIVTNVLEKKIAVSGTAQGDLAEHIDKAGTYFLYTYFTEDQLNQLPRYFRSKAKGQKRIYEYDKQNLRGQGLFAISIIDKSGRTALFSTQARVTMLPNQSFGGTLATNDWQVIMPYSDWHVGGNTRAGSDVQQVLEQLGYVLDEDWLIN